MKKIFLLILCPCLVWAEKSPVSAKEEIQFFSREENKMSALNKDDEFIGFISRTKISTSPEQQVDVYYFKSLQALKSDKILCSKVADSIFGPEKEITLKRTHSGLVASRSAGQICELVMTDPDPHGKIKERHLLVKVLHAKVYAFVFRFSKTPKAAEVEDIYQFTEGLR